MDKFWQLLEESVIVQSAVTLILIATLCVMLLRGQPIPDLLSSITFAVLGFWFGSKVQLAISKRSKA
jgi:hypothetical protein